MILFALERTAIFMTSAGRSVWKEKNTRDFSEVVTVPVGMIAMRVLIKEIVIFKNLFQKKLKRLKLESMIWNKKSKTYLRT